MGGTASTIESACNVCDCSTDSGFKLVKGSTDGSTNTMPYDAGFTPMKRAPAQFMAKHTSPDQDSAQSSPNFYFHSQHKHPSDSRHSPSSPSKSVSWGAHSEGQVSPSAHPKNRENAVHSDNKQRSLFQTEDEKDWVPDPSGRRDAVFLKLLEEGIVTICLHCKQPLRKSKATHTCPNCFKSIIPRGTSEKSKLKRILQQAIAKCSVPYEANHPDNHRDNDSFN